MKPKRGAFSCPDFVHAQKSNLSHLRKNGLKSELGTDRHGSGIGVELFSISGRGSESENFLGSGS